MILRRLMQHMKEQNWIAVGLDLAIVILGIFLGFQVTEWNAQRQDYAHAQVLTARLIVDLEDELWRISAERAYAADLANVANTTLDALEGRREISDADLMINAYRSSQIWWASNSRSTYDELVTTGAINLIDNPALRQAATEYYNTPLDELSLTYGTSLQYRERFRSVIPPQLHSLLDATCRENVYIETGDYNSLENILDFPCDFSAPESDIADFAFVLRNDPSLPDLLRLRINSINAQSQTLPYYTDLLNLAIESEKPQIE